jgi:hypothetical protein
MGQAVHRYENCTELIRITESTIRFLDDEGKAHMTNLSYEMVSK